MQHPRAEPSADGCLKVGSINQGYLLHEGPRSTACSRRWKDRVLVQTYLDSQTHWSLYFHESGSKWTLNVSPMCEEGSNSRSLCSYEVQLFILSGHSYELRCNLIRCQQYSMRGRDNTLNSKWLGTPSAIPLHTRQYTHRLFWTGNFHRGCEKLTGYLSSLCLGIGLANTLAPKVKSSLIQVSQPPVLLTQSSKELSYDHIALPLKHKIKHDQDKQVQKAEEKIYIFFKSKSADLTETPQQADLQNKAVLFLYAVTSSNKVRFLSEQRERSWRDKER